MKILVIDDSALHRRAAEVLSKEYDCTIVETYDEAQRLLSTRIDYASIDEYMAEAGVPRDSPRDTKEKNDNWVAAYRAAEEKATVRPSYGVVLIDLLLPASAKAQGDEGREHVGKEMPLGTTLAFLALQNGLKRVAVVTDTNHHSHPASAAFDPFPEEAFSMGDFRVICSNSGHDLTYMEEESGEIVTPEFVRSEEGCKKYPYSREVSAHSGLVIVKDWGRVLSRLIE